jgi:serine/threonine-protein kinase
MNEPTPSSGTRSDSELQPPTGTLNDPAPVAAPSGTLGDSALTPPPLDPSLAAPAPNQAASRVRWGRYEVLGTVGEGGMGSVVRVHDSELNRDLALKVLREDQADRLELERRFLEEAQVAAQLQHPNIAPVHDVGRLPDGRPYFTMKLVQGRTLAVLLGERPEPARELSRFLVVFEHVCQALAFAHSKQVIHRDLKPHNIMVGRFGEVQVMDWGLAKVLTPGAEKDAASESASVVQSQRSDDDDAATRAGTILGTPAYMAPEQARGELEQLDQRCDVFGLGAILCEILTGLAPFTASGRGDALLRAQQGDLAAANERLDGCKADPKLIELAKGCLASAPADRPRNAGDVAARIASYQQGVAERLRLAQMERATAQVTAAGKRRSLRLMIALGATALVMMGLGLIIAYWILTGPIVEQELLSRLRRELTDSETQAIQKNHHESFEKLRKELEEHAVRYRSTNLPERVGAVRTDAQKEVNEVAKRQFEKETQFEEFTLRLDQARIRRWLIDKHNSFDEASEQLFREAFALQGVKLNGMNLKEAASKLKDVSPTISSVGLDGWARVLQRKDAEQLRRLANLFDEDRCRRRIRDCILNKDVEALHRLRDALNKDVEALARPREATAKLDLETSSQCGAENERINVRDQLGLPPNWPEPQLIQLPEPHTLLLLADALRACQDEAGSLEVLKAGFKLYSGIPDLRTELAVAYHRANPPLLQEAIDLYLIEDLHFNPEGLSDYSLYPLVVLNNRSAALHAQGKLRESLDVYKTKIRRERHYPEAHDYLINGIKDRGKMEAAFLGYYKDAAQFDWSSSSHQPYGLALRLQGKLKESREWLHWDRPKLDNWRVASQFERRNRAYRECDRLLRFEARLPQVLGDAELPVEPADLLSYADVCRYKRREADATRFYVKAFALHPNLDDELGVFHRYNAACVAARAGAGQDAAASGADAAERTRFRAQSRRWLQDLLDAAAKPEPKDAPPAVLAACLCLCWQTDPDLAAVRDKDALAKLPDAERKDWQKLWSDVDALLRKTEAK